MKKLLLTATILSLLIPASLFGAAPSDDEVKEATVAVLSLFGMVFMSTMVGEVPEGVESNINAETGEASVTFDRFEAASFFASMSDMIGELPEEDKPVFNFESLSGTLEVDASQNLSMNVRLYGGNVRTLQLTTSGENLVSLDANGKSYMHLEQIFQEM